MINLSRSSRSLLLASALFISPLAHAFSGSLAVESLLGGAKGLERLGTVIGSKDGSKQLERLLADFGVPSSAAQKALRDPQAAREALNQAIASHAGDKALEGRVTSLLGDENVGKWKAEALPTEAKKASKGDVAKLLKGGKGSINLGTETVLSARVQELVSVAEHLQAEGRATGELVQGFRAALTTDPKVAEVVGEGFTKGCAEMQPLAVNNLVTSYVDSAGASDAAVAVRASLQKTTRVTVEKARQRTCALAGAPCKLYGAPVQQACSSGVAF